MRVQSLLVAVAVLLGGELRQAVGEQAAPQLPTCADLDSVEAAMEPPSAKLECRLAQFKAAATLDKRQDIAEEIAKTAKEISVDDANGVRVTDATIDHLAALLNDDNDAVRLEIAASLGWIGPKARRAVPALLRAADRIFAERRTWKVILGGMDSSAAIGVALERITGRPANSFFLVTDLSYVVDDPISYAGRKFRGYVYVYPAPGYYELYPVPVRPNPEIDKFDVTFLPGRGLALNRLRPKLKAGERLLIRGRLSPMKSCFVERSCAPFLHPVDIDDLEVIRRGGDN